MDVRAIGAGAAAAAVLIFHAVITTFALLPPNPLRNEIARIGAFTYFDLVFQQDWKLFAPTPPMSVHGLVVRCQGSAGTDTGWIETNSVLIENTFDDLTGVAPKLRYVHNGVRDLLVQSHRAALAQECGVDPEEPPANMTDEQRTCSAENKAALDALTRDTPGYEVAVRYGIDACSPFFTNTDERIVDLHMRSLEVLAVPFSERETIGTASELHQVKTFDFPSMHFSEGETPR